MFSGPDIYILARDCAQARTFPGIIPPTRDPSRPAPAMAPASTTTGKPTLPVKNNRFEVAISRDALPFEEVLHRAREKYGSSPSSCAFRVYERDVDNSDETVPYMFRKLKRELRATHLAKCWLKSPHVVLAYQDNRSKGRPSRIVLQDDVTLQNQLNADETRTAAMR